MDANFACLSFFCAATFSLSSFFWTLHCLTGSRSESELMASKPRSQAWRSQMPSYAKFSSLVGNLAARLLMSLKWAEVALHRKQRRVDNVSVTAGFDVHHCLSQNVMNLDKLGPKWNRDWA